eukprot:scpid61452/ scgid25151/ CD97 antigen
MLVIFHGLVKDATLCKAVAMLMHFSTLCVFSMMAIACGELYRSIICVFDEKKRSKLWSYAWIISITISGLIVIIAVAVTRAGAYGTKFTCWFNEDDPTRYNVMYFGTFITPVALVLIFNFVVCVKVALQVTKRVKSENRGTKLQQYKRMMASITSLSTIMGLTWALFFLIRFIKQHEVISMIGIVVNALQGVLLFLIFVVRSEKVRKTLTTRWEKRRSRQQVFHDIASQRRPSHTPTAQAALSSSQQMSAAVSSREPSKSFSARNASLSSKSALEQESQRSTPTATKYCTASLTLTNSSADQLSISSEPPVCNQGPGERGLSEISDTDSSQEPAGRPCATPNNMNKPDTSERDCSQELSRAVLPTQQNIPKITVSMM